jgi:catalase (peroxidase I)
MSTCVHAVPPSLPPSLALKCSARRALEPTTAHGAAEASKHVGAEPEGEGLAAQGLGWLSRYRSGKGADTITSGLEGAWTANPTAWDNGYFHNLFSYQWTKTKSPAGATQWIPTDPTVCVLAYPELCLALCWW